MKRKVGNWTLLLKSLGWYYTPPARKHGPSHSPARIVLTVHCTAEKSNRSESDLCSCEATYKQLQRKPRKKIRGFDRRKI